MEILESFIEFSPEKKTLEVWFSTHLDKHKKEKVCFIFLVYFAHSASFCSSILLFKTVITLTVMNDTKSFHFVYKVPADSIWH